MNTHRPWIWAIASVLAVAAGQACAQTHYPLASPSFATFSQGSPVMQQASFNACGACNGAGCGICGVAPTASPMESLPACGACGTQCGGACGGGSMGAVGPMGGMGGMGGPFSPGMGHMGAMNGGRYGGYGTMKHGQENGPFGGGGCCAPIWYDLHVEWLYLTRDQSSRHIDFASREIGGPIVLSTDDLDLEDAHGFRATYSLLVGPSTALELTYFGTHHWDDAAAVTGDADLYSVFSNFGTFPSVPGFPQTVDQADFHRIEYSSELNNAEINIRRRWVSANCLLHGSYMAGVRYVSLDEWFSHDTLAASGGSMNYDVDVSNDIAGVQVGTDLFVCISPRFKIGAEVEAGVYGNDAKASTRVNTVDGGVAATPINEELSETDVAFVGEAGVTGLFRVTPRLTIRGGYTLLYLDGVALGTDNFNEAAPFASFSADRVPRLYNDADVFYHGANLGFTWTW